MYVYLQLQIYAYLELDITRDFNYQVDYLSTDNSCGKAYTSYVHRQLVFTADRPFMVCTQMHLPVYIHTTYCLSAWELHIS